MQQLDLSQTFLKFVNIHWLSDHNQTIIATQKQKKSKNVEKLYFNKNRNNNNEVN